MSDWPPVDPTDVDDVTAERERLLAAVEDHAGRIARQLALLQGGDYGRRAFETDRATWTVKYEAGDLEFLLFDPATGADVYVVSTKRPPEPAELVTALADYPAFVAAYNAYVDSLDGVLADVDTSFPEPASTAEAIAERDRVLDSIEDACARMAGELHRFEGGDYGSFTARVDGDRWELKWSEGGVSYLRIGGRDGVYLLSQYGAPSARDVREYAPRFAGFVRAYNEEVSAVGDDLAEIEL